jgi:pimeloyl-ACP methyl ester carboxylesterase
MGRKLKVTGLALAGIAALLAAIFLISDRERLDLDEKARTGQPGGWVRLADGVVHYQWDGPATGPVVVMVNPFSLPLYIWEPNMEAFTQNGYRVLRYDLYGRGFSERPTVTYDLDLFVSQLEQLLEALAVPMPVDLVGVSMGGEIAAAFTARRSDLVRRLCLIDPQAMDVTWKTIFPMNIRGVGEYIMTVYVIPFVLSSPRSDFYRPESVTGWADRFAPQTRYRGFRRALLSTLRSFSNDYRDSYSRVGKLGKPVLLIWGEKDTSIPISNAARVLTAIPQAEFHAIPDAGHLSEWERADIVNPLLSAFFAPGGPPRSPR